MSTDTRRALEPPLQGQLLRRTNRREVAIFLRDGALWIADFIDGHGEICEAATWFRFNCAETAISAAERRMLLESALPLSADLAARIETLFRSSDSPGAASGAEATCPKDLRSEQSDRREDS
jgi:hypothetical protein